MIINNVVIPIKMTYNIIKLILFRIRKYFTKESKLMFIQILSAIHNLTTLLFGIFISAFFLGVKQNHKNIFTLLLFSCFEGILYITSFLLFGEIVSNQIYPLIVHLPLTLFLYLYYKYPLISCSTSIFSAYLCCQISNWIGLFTLSITGAKWCYYFSRIITTFITFFLLCHFVCRTTTAIFAKDKRELCIIGFLPFVYYIFDYVSTKFSNLLYSGSKAIVEFMGFAFCIAYLVFLLVYFREYEQKQEIRQCSNLMEMQLLSIQKEIEHVKSSKHTLSILRHDMRHHLSIILTLLQNDNTDKAIKYIKKIGEAYDDTIITTYCKNEMLNSVISIYQMRFTDRGISLNCNISCESIPFSEIAFCAILSNALENSMHALEDANIEEKWANLTISNRENCLLLRLENPTRKVPKFIDGVPVSGKKGHDIGVKSIIYYVDQLNGQWHFSVSNGCFIVKVII